MTQFELRIYGLATSNSQLSDEQFIEKAENCGEVFSLQRFLQADNINTKTKVYKAFFIAVSDVTIPPIPADKYFTTVYPDKITFVEEKEETLWKDKEVLEIKGEGIVQVENLRNVTIHLSLETIRALNGEDTELGEADSYVLYSSIPADIYAQNEDDKETLTSVNKLFEEKKIDMCICDYCL